MSSQANLLSSRFLGLLLSLTISGGAQGQGRSKRSFYRIRNAAGM
jgi:hypothetical protein